MTEIEAHRFLNNFKTAYSIDERSEKRGMPKGTYLFAKYKTFKSKNFEPVEGFVIKGKNSVNNIISDIHNQYVCTDSDILEFRRASKEEIEITIPKLQKEVIKKVKKLLNG